jgi:hypothetical protein
MKVPLPHGFSRQMRCPECNRELFLSDAYWEKCGGRSGDGGCGYSWEHAQAVNGIEAAETLRSLTPIENQIVAYGLDPRHPLAYAAREFIDGIMRRP